MEQTKVSFANRFINIAWDLGPEVLRELSNKNYKRVGGIILKSATDEVVAFIRQNNQPLGEIVKNSADDLAVRALDLPQVNPAADLSVSTMGPTTIMLKLNGIEQKLTTEMAKLNRKFDFGIYAKFQAGLTLADNAFRMSKQSSRQTAANNAIALFLEAENFFLKLFDEEMEQQSLAAYPYLATLFLAYVSEHGAIWSWRK